AEYEENDRANGGNADGTQIELSSHHRSPAKESSTEPATDESADYAEEDRDDAARRVPPWHQKLCQGPGNEAEQYPVKPERQTLVLREVTGALGNARSCAAPRRHAINPEKNERSDDGENDALDRESVEPNA